MTQYPESGIKLVADTKEYTSAMDYAIFQADYFDSLDDMTLNISADVDTSSFQIDDLPLDGETINFTVDATVEGDLADLPLDGETVNYTVEADVTGDVSELPVDGEQIDTTVDVVETDTAKETLSAVNTIKNLKVIETVWNITGNAVELFKKVGDWAVTPMLDLEDAVAKVRAQTHDSVPDVEHLIKGIFYDDLGDSIDQVGKLVIKAAQIKAPVDEATRAALEFTHTFTDQNPEQVMDTLNQMVIGKLAPNFTEAGNLMVRAFQTGANRGGDLLTAIGDNATAIHDLGLNGPQALSFIKTGMDNGFKSAQQVLDILLKIKQNATNAAGNASSDVSKTLATLGIANPAETGEAWSADFFESVIEGIKKAPVSDTEKEAMFSNLVGGKQGGKTFSAFLKISPDEAKDIFANLEGASKEAAKTADDSLRGAIDDFMLAANEAANNFLSSEQLDLPGKIAALKTGLQDALDVLANNGSLSEALTVALKPIGFDEEFQGLESALGNFVIGILQAVAQLQDLTGHGAEAAGTRATIATLGTTQLAYDLKIANADQVATDIQTAISRGVTPEEIAGSVSTAVEELVKAGAGAQAQALLDEFQKSTPNYQIAQGLNGEQLSQADAAMREGGDRLKQAMEQGLVVNITPSLAPDAIEKLQKEIDSSIADTHNNSQQAANQSRLDAADAIDETTLSTDLLTTSATEAAPLVKTQADAVRTQGQNASDATTPINNAATATKKQGDSAAKAVTPVGSVAGEMDAVTGSATVLAPALTAVNTALGIIIATASGLKDAAANVAQKQGQLDAAGSTDSSGGGGATPTKTKDTGSAIGGRSVGAIIAALQPFIPGGSGGAGTVNNTVNNTNYVQSEAQADTLGYSTAEQLRGMA